jgi:hypothetical protein
MNPASKLPSALNKVDAEVVFLPVGFTEDRDRRELPGSSAAPCMPTRRSVTSKLLKGKVIDFHSKYHDAVLGRIAWSLLVNDCRGFCRSIAHESPSKIDHRYLNRYQRVYEWYPGAPFLQKRQQAACTSSSDFPKPSGFIAATIATNE